MAKRRILVKRDGDIYWFAPSLAAQKSGMSKADLATRALAGDLQYQSDDLGNPACYAAVQIMALA